MGDDLVIRAELNYPDGRTYKGAIKSAEQQIPHGHGYMYLSSVNLNINSKTFRKKLTDNPWDKVNESIKNKFKLGFNFSYDSYLETVDTFYFNRNDISVGSFFEYSYDSLENFNLIAGIRIDSHNRLGTFVTPRLHLRYLP